jgi:deoxyribonuclease V
VWPSDAGALIALQRQISRRSAEPWTPPLGPLLVGGCWVCFPRGLTGPGKAGDRAWAVAVVLRGVEVVDQNVRLGEAAAPYVPGLLAARIGGVFETAVRGLAVPPEVLLVDATGSDHPRRAGLAIHLGAVLELPTIGVTHRPLTGEGDWPADRRGATSHVRIGDDVVASWVRTRPGTRPVVVHPGWRVGLDDAVGLVLQLTPRRRTPEPLRLARSLARRARAVAAHPSAQDG